MDEKEFQRELERIREDVEDLPKPQSACEYFHGREKSFLPAQLEAAVEFFLTRQQESFERRGNHGS